MSLCGVMSTTHLAAPNNTYTTYLSTSRCNTCITTPTPNTPDLTDTRTRYQLNTTTYTFTHEIPTMFSAHYPTQSHYGSHILRFCSPLVAVQNTTCSSAHSCSPDDGHNDARNMLRWKFDNEHHISWMLLVSLSSPNVHDARSQEPKILKLTLSLYLFIRSALYSF